MRMPALEGDAMAEKRPVSNLLGLAVLSYLSQEPMHPYALGRALRDHGDARSIKYNPGSLYMVVGQLARAGLVAELATSRDGQRPEHTVYELTDLGRRELGDWLRELVGQPRHEFPAFVAALAFVSALPPGEVSELLTGRLDLLARQREEITGLLADSQAQGVPGLFLLEEEYRLVQLDAEYGFVRRLIARMADPATDWIPMWADHHKNNGQETG
jgi:DNA-binding PadR family transcriptional regulator